MEILSNDDLRKAAPSIFATHPQADVSSHYAFIPTIQIVDALRDEGFMPVRAMSSATRNIENRDFGKRMLRFRRAENLGSRLVGDEIPELVLINSHNRSSGYQLSAGIFRLVCSNGMVVKSSSFGDINIRHSGDVTGEVIEGSYKIIKEMPAIIDAMHHMKGVLLTDQQRNAYAESALILRYGVDDDGIIKAPISADSLLQLRRPDDNKKDIWTTFNVVQENFMRGGLRGVSSNGRNTRTRAVKSVYTDTHLNKALWMLTEKMTELVIAGADYATAAL